MLIPEHCMSYDSFKSLDHYCQHLYMWFITKYRQPYTDKDGNYHSISPIKTSSADIAKDTNIGITSVKKALNYLYLQGYIKVFKEPLIQGKGAYNRKNVYIPILIWKKTDRKYYELIPIPIPEELLCTKDVVIKDNESKTVTIKYGIYKQFNEKQEQFNNKEKGDNNYKVKELMIKNKPVIYDDNGTMIQVNVDSVKSFERKFISNMPKKETIDNQKENNEKYKDLLEKYYSRPKPKSNKASKHEDT